MFNIVQKPGWFYDKAITPGRGKCCRAGFCAKGLAILFQMAFLLLSCHSLPGQARLAIEPLDTTAGFVGRRLKPPKTFADSAAVQSFLNEKIRELHLAAFLEASVDSLLERDSSFTAYLHLGPAYGWVALKTDSVPEIFLDASGFRERLYRGRPIRFTQ